MNAAQQKPRWTPHRVRSVLFWTCALLVALAIGLFAMGGALFRWAVAERRAGLVHAIAAIHPAVLSRGDGPIGYPALAALLQSDPIAPEARATALVILRAMNRDGRRVRRGDLRYSQLVAAKRGDQELLAALQAVGTRPVDDDLWTALCWNAGADVVQFLIRMGANPNAGVHGGEEPVAAVAARTPTDPAAVAALVATNGRFDVDYADSNGNNLLHLIAANPSMDGRAVAAAVEAGVRLEERNRLGATPLVLTFRLPPPAGPLLLEAFLSNGASPTERFPGNRTPLHFAAEAGAPWAIDQLIAAGARQDAQDVDGNAPMHLAVKNHRYFMRYANPTDARQRKWTFERIRDTRRAVESLQRSGADLDLPNGEGVTPRAMIAEHKLPFDFLHAPPPEWTR